MTLAHLALTALGHYPACAPKHLWRPDAFIAPVMFQWCEKHRSYHQVEGPMGPDGRKLISEKHSGLKM